MKKVHFWEKALVELLKIPSVSGNESTVSGALRDLIGSQFPFASVELVPVTERRCNVRALYGSPRFTLTSHLDTRPGCIPVTIDDETITGRGACNAKGQIVSQLWGLARAVEAGLEDFCCHYVIGEEIDGIGARELVRSNPRTDYLINGLPTGNRFVERCWGSVTLDLVVTDAQSCTAPSASGSAVHRLLEDLEDLTKLDRRDLRINVGLISGGSTATSVAERASAAIGVIYRESFSECLALLSNAVSHSKISVKALREPAQLFVPSSDDSNSIEVEFGSSCSLYSKHFPHVVLYGPGDVGDTTARTEAMSRAHLNRSARDICGLCLELANKDAREPLPLQKYA
jgi:acetylornithine deacetylase